MEEKKVLTETDLIVNHTYSAKKVSYSGDLVNDRQILYVGRSGVQYDSPTIGFGKHYPTVSVEAFLKWADKDITDIMPHASWRSRP